MLFEKLSLHNFLSFGPNSAPIPLGPLNVLIGPNGVGKSNLVEAFAVLRALPKGRPIPVQAGGTVADWIWKGGDGATATIRAYMDRDATGWPYRYSLSFSEDNYRFFVSGESFAKLSGRAPKTADTGHDFFTRIYAAGKETAEIKSASGEVRAIRSEELNRETSILAQRKDPDQYPELTWLGEQFAAIRIYRDWSFGRNAPARLPQPADAPADFLEEDFSNLGLILNRIKDDRTLRRTFLEHLRDLYPTIDDFDVRIIAGNVQVMLDEQDLGRIPATRLSDGTLRYLCLLAILLHPDPPPLICIEEPELGLHPDVVRRLAELLKDASTRTQVVATTHSEVLVDALTDSPGSLLVCERHEGSTVIERVDPARFAVWLEDRSLGELWSGGHLGGNRW